MKPCIELDIRTGWLAHHVPIPIANFDPGIEWDKLEGSFIAFRLI